MKFGQKTICIGLFLPNEIWTYMQIQRLTIWIFIHKDFLFSALYFDILSVQVYIDNSTFEFR